MHKTFWNRVVACAGVCRCSNERVSAGNRQECAHVRLCAPEMGRKIGRHNPCAQIVAHRYTNI